MAGSQHLIQHPNQGTIFQSSGNSFLVAELLCDSFTGTMCTFFDSDIDAKPRWQGLFKPHSDTKADNGSETAMRYRWRNVNSNGRNARLGRGGRKNVYVRKLDYVERTER